MKKVLSILLGVVAAALAICAIWLSADWGWLKFGLTSFVFAFTAILLASSDSIQKRP